MGLRANFWKILRSGDVIALVELLFLPWGTHSDMNDLRIGINKLGNKHVEKGSDFGHPTSFWELKVNFTLFRHYWCLFGTTPMAMDT